MSDLVKRLREKAIDLLDAASDDWDVEDGEAMDEAADRIEELEEYEKKWRDRYVSMYVALVLDSSWDALYLNEQKIFSGWYKEINEEYKEPPK